MVSLWDFLVFTGALSIAAFTPGPGLAAIVATVLAQGARRTVWFCAGVIIGDLVWLTLSLSGLALVAQQIPAVFLAIKWAGAAYLAYLAWKIWNAPPEAGPAARQRQEKSAVARILGGLAVTMGNPKAMLFYIALLPNLIDAERISVAAVLPLYAAVVGVLAAVFAVYITAAENARRAMQNSRAVQRFNRATAMALGGAAAWIASR